MASPAAGIGTGEAAGAAAPLAISEVRSRADRRVSRRDLAEAPAPPPRRAP